MKGVQSMELNVYTEPDTESTAGDLRRLFLFTGFAIFLAGSLILVVGTVSASTLDRMIANSENPEAFRRIGQQELYCYWAGACMFALSVICGFLGLREMAKNSPFAPDDDSGRYDLYLVGIGYALVLLAILNFVAMAGFAYVGQLETVLHVKFSFDSTQDPTTATTTKPVVIPRHIHSVLFMLMMPGYSVLGALFFTANSLRKKRDTLSRLQASATPPIITPDAPACPPPERATGNRPSDIPQPTNPTEPDPVSTGPKAEIAVKERFDKTRFWGGLWFRIGEGLVFTLVIFLIVIGSSSPATSGAYLLLASLLLGMFVKTGEGLIAGLADKFFAAAKAIVK